MTALKGESIFYLERSQEDFPPEDNEEVLIVFSDHLDSCILSSTRVASSMGE